MAHTHMALVNHSKGGLHTTLHHHVIANNGLQARVQRFLARDG